MGAFPAMLLEKARVSSFLRSLRRPVAWPQTTPTGDVFFEVAPLPPESFTLPDYVNSLISPVKFAFPQTQVLFRYRLGPSPLLEPHGGYRELAIFGIRSCDVVALRRLEGFFGRTPADTPFQEAVQGLLLISLTCERPGPHCFCPCANAGPALERGHDLQLTPFDEVYLVEVGSERGWKAIEQSRSLFREAPPEMVEERRARTEAALQRFSITTHFGTGVRKVTSRKVPQEIWERMALRCIECGGCAYVCPLCTCFDVVDRPTGNGTGWRERTWDSCQFSGYSREASGYNPRAERVQRFQRRFYHKLNLLTIEREGHHGCVGCGRCVQTCFGKTDLPTVVNALREEKAEGMRVRAKVVGGSER